MITRGTIIWLTGLPASGKTTVGASLVKKLNEMGVESIHLDGDDLRGSISKGLGYDKDGREESVRRAASVADHLANYGVFPVVSMISPYANTREEIKGRYSPVFEVYINASLELCESRDPKGLYKKARNGEIPNFTGVSHPYEPPESPNIEVSTNNLGPDACVDAIMDALSVIVS